MRILLTGIPSSDHQGPGPDPSYGNYQYQGGCVPLNHPDLSGCSTHGAGSLTDLQPGYSYPTATPQRQIASKRRQLAGIYSASGLDNEGKARITLMLSTIQQSCFTRGVNGNSMDAGLDAWWVLFNTKWKQAEVFITSWLTLYIFVFPLLFYGFQVCTD